MVAESVERVSVTRFVMVPKTDARPFADEVAVTVEEPTRVDDAMKPPTVVVPPMYALP